MSFQNIKYIKTSYSILVAMDYTIDWQCKLTCISFVKCEEIQRVSSSKCLTSQKQIPPLCDNFLNEKKSRILSRINRLICFNWAIGSVNYWIIAARRQNTLITLITSGVNKQYEKWLSLCCVQQDYSAFSILLHLNEKKSQMLSRMNQLIWFHWSIRSVN